MNTTKTATKHNAIVAFVLSLALMLKNQFITSVQTYLPTPTHGRSGIADMRYVIYIIIIFLIAAILFPIAMAQVTAATTTSWGAGVGPIFAQLLPILTIIAIALHIFGYV